MSNLPSGSIWRIKDTDPQSQYCGMTFVYDFSSFNCEFLHNAARQYIWENHRTGRRTLRGLREMLRSILFFDTFCTKKNVNSMMELNHSLMDDYQSFLRAYISSSTMKPLSFSTQRTTFSALKSLVGWCRVFMPETVPNVQLFTGREYRNTYGDRVKIEFIPEEILEQINEALKVEDNPYLKYGIQILECTGMRVGDLLLLRTDCLSENPITGYSISWFDHKNRRIQDCLPIPKKCGDAIKAIVELTEELREEAEDEIRDSLFIYRPNWGTNRTSVIRISKQTFTKWCHTFCENHSIRDGSGKMFQLKSHMFRRTLATDMFSKGANLNVVKEVLGHSDPSTTKKHYAEIKDTDRMKMFNQIGIIGNIKSIDKEHIENEEELKWFRKNCEGRARLCDGYCTKPIHDGQPCDIFLSRQKCYMCSRYITTPDDLETHRAYLKELQEMLDTNIYGEHFAEHIIPTITILSEIVRRLEKMKDER